MAFDTSTADDFGAGIYLGREAPAGAVLDTTNSLIDDEGQIFKRGATALYSTSDTAQTLQSLWAFYMRAVAAPRVLAKGSTATYVLDGSLAPVSVSGLGASLGRPASLGDYAIFSLGAPGNLWYYAGSLKGTDYSTGTISVTNGSATVTGAGTSWSANVDAGMILIGPGGVFGVVKNVGSNTSITLTKPWTGSTSAGAAYTLSADLNLVVTTIPASSTRSFVIAAQGRLLLTSGNRIFFLDPENPLSVNALTDYIELPAAANIVGAEGSGDTAHFFTTLGVFNVSNLSYDPVDDFGNPQWQVDQVNKDIVLWDDLGIAAWDSALIVPAIDDVYLASPDFEVRVLSEGLRRNYRTYVNAGYQPGMASVHRGHYFLPILNPANSNAIIDVFVCRVDRPYQSPDGRVFYPWTRWGGHAGGAAYATLVSEATRSPKLLGVNGLRVTDLTGCMEKFSSSSQDANSTTPVFSVTLNDFPIGTGPFPSQAINARSVYETQQSGTTPSVTMFSLVGTEAASPVAADLLKGGGTSTGTDYSAWRVNRRATKVRLMFYCASQLQSLIVRSISLTSRRNGRT